VGVLNRSASMQKHLRRLRFSVCNEVVNQSMLVSPHAAQERRMAQGRTRGALHRGKALLQQRRHHAPDEACQLVLRGPPAQPRQVAAQAPHQRRHLALRPAEGRRFGTYWSESGRRVPVLHVMSCCEAPHMLHHSTCNASCPKLMREQHRRAPQLPHQHRAPLGTSY